MKKINACRFDVRKKLRPDKRFVLKMLCGDYSSVTARTVEQAARDYRRSGGHTDAGLPEEWSKVLRSLEKDGVLTRVVQRGASSSSGKWLSRVRDVPVKRAVYRLARGKRSAR